MPTSGVTINWNTVAKRYPYTFEHLRKWTTAAISVAENEKRRRARLEILPVR